MHKLALSAKWSSYSNIWKCHHLEAKNVALTLFDSWMYSESTAKSKTYALVLTQVAYREWGQGHAKVSSAAQALL